MATITHGGSLPDSSNKSDFYGLVDNASIAGIVNADVSSAAAIALSKLAGTANTASGVASYNSSGDLVANAWADYGGTSTIVGWTSYTNKHIYTKRVGKLVLVQFNLSGTSNSTAITFTLPYAMDSTTQAEMIACYAVDNGGTAAWGAISLPGGSSSTVTLYLAPAGTGWTNSGTKTVSGQFWYQSA